MPENALGLAMTGGGARGAYQAGVLKRVGEIARVRAQGNPFAIVGGASAGAINGAAVAVGSDDFSPATDRLAKFWSRLEPHDIFRTDLLSQTRNSITWIIDLSFGGFLGGGNAQSLLDATPLRYLLAKSIDCSRIQRNINAGHLYAFAISATNYNSGKSYLFIQGKKGHPMWNRVRRVTLATEITIDQLCASAAIPLIFQPVKLETEQGTAFFGDGCVRLQQPLSPVIRLGAERILAIGVRGEKLEHQKESYEDSRTPSLAQILGVLLNVMFLDHLASDVEHLERLNRLIREGHIAQTHRPEKMRSLKALIITPSVDLSKLAESHQRDAPYLLSYFVNGLARDASSCSDLMSYLLFTPRYMKALADIGYQDASRRIDEIEEFLYSGNGSTNGREKSRVPASSRRKVARN